MKQFKWDKKYLYWGVTAFLVVVASISFFLLLDKWSGFVKALRVILGALSPVIYGILIAYLLNKPLKPAEKVIFTPLANKLFKNNGAKARKAARIFSVVAMEFLTVAVVAALLTSILPQIFYSISYLVTRSSEYLNIIVAWVEEILNGNELLEPVAVKWLNSLSSHFFNWIETNVLPEITTLISNITGGVISIVKTVVNIAVGMVVSVYLLYNKETFCAQCKKGIYSIFKPRTANKLMDELDFVNKAFGDYIVGTLLDALVVGVANYIFMLIAGMPYSALISIIVAVTNLIPVFGPVIGAVPSGLLLLLEDPVKSLIFIIFTIILQQLDGNVIKPRIHSSKQGISGFWIMFAILLFGGLFGIIGMVLGVPIMSVLYSAVKRINHKRLLSRGLPDVTADYEDIYRIDPETNRPILKSEVQIKDNVQTKENAAENQK